MSNLKNCIKKNNINKLDSGMRQLLGIDLIHPVENFKS